MPGSMESGRCAVERELPRLHNDAIMLLTNHYDTYIMMMLS